MNEKLKAEWQKWGRLTPNNALYDRTLLWLFLALLSIGFVMVSSAAIPISTRLYQDPFHFAVRDGIYVLAALCACAFVVQIPTERWQRFSGWFLLGTLFLLALTLVIGKQVNGAVRWISIGPINFQAAELAKLALICYFAGFYVRKFEEIRQAKLGFIRPTAVVIALSIFLLKQPDLGSTVVLFVLTFAMLFIVGAKITQFILVGVGGVALFVFAVLLSEYRLRRVTSFMNPFDDAYGDGLQLARSQMAFGSGEFWGKGLGNSVQKLEYLPEAHTDFVMAIVAEEFGFIGIVIVVLLLCALTFKALSISKVSLKAEQRFKGFFAFGIGTWIFLQGFVNLGVASGLLPTKGLTFPLVSYGGSSLVMMSVAIAILFRIDHENRLARIGHAHLNEE